MSALLQALHLTKRYGSLVAVNDLSFELGEGEILGLIGANGAGKTTVVNLIAGSVRHWTGEIRLRGRSLRRLHPYQVGRLGIARTFQVAQPFVDMTALENVMVGALFAARGSRRFGTSRSKSLDVLDSLGLADKASQPASTLNAPERKRLEIARALAMDPELLLLDEVMAGLTPPEIDAAIQVIADVHARGVSILMVEHVMRAVTSLADRVVVLHHGKKMTEGRPLEVLTNQLVISAYLGGREARAEPSIVDGREVNAP